MNWENYPNFTEDEFRCKHTGKCEMDEEFMKRLQKLRNVFNKPMKISSGYRDKSHPSEVGKKTTGAHTLGKACDVAIQGADALRLVYLAISMGFTGIGIQQKGSGRFIHLDTVTTELPRPTIWSY